MKNLLYLNKLEIEQDKWYKDYLKGTISVVSQLYTLSVTTNKREIIFDSVGRFIDTKPFILKGGRRVVNDPFILYYLSPIIKKLSLSPPSQL
jgi:hypothetical protein